MPDNSEEKSSFTATEAYSVWKLLLKLKMSDKLVERIYKILGGDSWFADGETPFMRINAEREIEQSRRDAFTDSGNNQTQEVRSLIQVMDALHAVNRHRAGHQRFPARLPKDLTNDGNDDDTVSLLDDASLQEWMIKQFDAWFGAYPIKLKYKDANNTEKQLKFENQAELMAEMMGMLLSINADTDLLQDLGMKTIIEAIAARMTAMQAYDYAKANSEFLGYQYKQESKDIEIAINPKAKNLKAFLQESTQKVSRFKWVDQDTLIEIARQLLIGVNIIKGAFWRSYNLFRDDLPGDRIKANRQKQKTNDDKDWNDFVYRMENQPSTYNPSGAPKPDLDKLTNNTASPDDQSNQSGGT